MKVLHIVIRVILLIALAASAVCSVLGYTFAQNIMKWVGYAALGVSAFALIITEVYNAYKKAKANGEEYSILDFFKTVYGCLPVLVGYAESLDTATGGAIKGNDKANAVLEKLKEYCNANGVKYYENYARDLLEPVIMSDKVIQAVQNGTLTLADMLKAVGYLTSDSPASVSTVTTTDNEVIDAESAADELSEVNEKLSSIIGKKENNNA